MHRSIRPHSEPIHFAVRVHEYTLKGVGGFLGLYSSTISAIAKRAAEAHKRQE